MNRKIVLGVALALFVAGCHAALSDAERAWCAEHPRSVGTAMQNLDLLTPIQGDDDLELWIAVVDSYFAGDEVLGAGLLSERQEADVDRGCNPAFESR